MTDEAENRLRLADAFWRLAQRVFGPRVMSDVVYWVNDNDTPRVAFVGNPLKVAQLFGLLDGGGESSPYLPSQIGRAIQSEMGVPLTPEDMREQWERSPAGLGDLLDRFSGQTVWQWADVHGPIGDEGLRVGFIPEPGYPWPAQDERYYSAKQRKWLPSDEPGWLIEVESRDEPGVMVPGVNPCLVFPADETKTTPGGPVCGELDGLPFPVMATHAMSLVDEPGDAEPSKVWHHKQLDAAIAGIKNCGGLLFPSLAVGPIPATNFGPVVLVAHLELVLDSLLPYRRHKRRRPCWVYGTDAWTKTTGGLMRDTAMELFDELHGDDQWYGRYIATLGVPAESHGGAFSDHQWHAPLTSTKQLASSLRKRMRGWSPDMEIEEFSGRNEAATPETKYAYLEAKAREVTRLDEFPFLIAPSFMKPTVTRFVKGVGYKGKVVFLREEPWMKDAMVLHSETRSYALYVWAWQVAEAVRELRPCVRIET